MAGVNVNVSEVTAALRTPKGRYGALEPALGSSPHTWGTPLLLLC